MRSREKRLIVVIVVRCVLLLSATVATARTIYVTKDGTSEFSIIQDAVEAADAGDTISIGPGRYNEGQTYSCPGWTSYVRVLVTKSSLTFVGAGPSTIIGQQEPWDLSQGDHRGIVAGPYFGCSESLDVSALRFEGMLHGINSEQVAVTVNSCEFSGIRYAVTNWHTPSVTISSCRFEHTVRDGAQIYGWGGVSGFIVEGCTFDLRDNWWSQKGVGLTGVPNGLIRECEFLGGYYGVHLYLMPMISVTDCQFDGQTEAGIGAYDSTFARIERCQFSNLNTVLHSLHGRGHVTLQDCQVDNVTDCTIWVQWPGAHTIHNCDLDKGARGVVWVDDIDICDEIIACDMTGNYWGTDNPDSIRAWIRDIDDSALTCTQIEYAPFRNESTPNEKTSMGGVKALFR